MLSIIPFLNCVMWYLALPQLKILQFKDKEIIFQAPGFRFGFWWVVLSQQQREGSRPVWISSDGNAKRPPEASVTPKYYNHLSYHSSVKASGQFLNMHKLKEYCYFLKYELPMKPREWRRGKSKWRTGKQRRYQDYSKY